MKKLERWRRQQPRDGSTAETPVPLGGGSETVSWPSQAGGRDGEQDDALKALRSAAMLQHEDTVPAAFYRAQGD